MTIQRGRAARALAVALTLGGVALGAQAQADTPQTRRAAAHEMMQMATSLIDVPRITHQMHDAMLAPMAQAMRQQNPQLTPAQLSRAVKVMSAATDEDIDAAMQRSLPKMMAVLEQFYAQNFNISELQELQRYYSSPTVRKAMQLMPDAMPEMMKPVIDDVTQAMPAMQAHVKEALAQLKSEGIELKQGQ
jgi:hypothetical protein